MGIRTGIFLVVLIVVITSVYSAPSELDRDTNAKCPAMCDIDWDCCEVGGCYLHACVICRIVGVSCQSDEQCCDIGGCYANRCVACRALGVSCQSDSQCCDDMICTGTGRCL